MQDMKMKSAMTLDRVLSRFGLASRAMAGEWIRTGRVKVNGRVVRDPDVWVRPEEDSFHLDGKRVKQARKLYLLFYKPKGVITSHGDPGARNTVYDCLDKSLPWVTPVGRLDRDTSGLLLLTNDTDFANFISDPASGTAKTYLVKLNGIISDETIAAFSSGVRMKKGDWARPRSVRRVVDRGKYSRLEVVLQEGKNREVRRMMEAVGFKVLKLVRTGIGPLTLEGLEIGKYRSLTRAEVAALRQPGIRRQESGDRNKSEHENQQACQESDPGTSSS
ncbi:MAG: rRNA pseudouridine synthase [Acidobacteriia bacterium]|nr:rRNA pseudouridine synthase [Terriglobia bacterium]